MPDHPLFPYFFQWATVAKICASGSPAKDNEPEWMLYWMCFLAGAAAR